MKENTFKMVTEDGKEIICNVLFTFDSEETKKSYIAYTDNTYEPDGSIKAYAAVYHPENLNAGFEPIETEKEWKVVETILEAIQEEVRSKIAQQGETTPASPNEQ
ncbi:MAG TPA: DUF1292 domain-containing protein [Candidatus Scybalousia intestinigallinarum]|nr:DUF1292 domain-containing protein [Candidatus Scybalousia intestinigallinarum]